MPKMRTHRGAAKRFKKTGSGGYKHKQAGMRHLSTHKSGKTVRQLRGLKMVSEQDAPELKRLLPYV